MAILRQALGPHELGSEAVRWMRTRRVETSDVLQAETRDAAVHCFIDLSSLPRARLYFADQSGQRFLSRDLDLDHGLDTLGKEALGQVVASSVETLLDDTTSAMDRQQMTTLLAERPRPSVADVEPVEVRRAGNESRSTTVDFGAFYSIQTFSREIALSQGPGVFGTVGAPIAPGRVSIRWSTQLVLPQQLEGPLVGARLDTIAFRLGAGGEHELGERVWVGLWLGGGIDVVHIDPRQGSTQIAQLTGSRYAETTLVTSVAELSVRLGRDVRVMGAIVADMDLRPRHYDLTTPSGTTAILKPWWVRPGFLVGIATWH